MKPQPISRKDFIRNSSVLLASASILSPGVANAAQNIRGGFADKSLSLKNVRLETGFDYDQDEVI